MLSWKGGVGGDLLGRGMRELSGEMEMFCILQAYSSQWVCAYMKIHQAVDLRFMHFMLCNLKRDSISLLSC